MEKQTAFKLYEKKQIPMLIGVMGLLVIALLVTYWVMPLWDSTRQILLDYERNVSTLDAKDKELNALQQFKIYLNKDQDKVALMNDVLPNKENMDDILIQLERLAVDNTLFVKSITVSDVGTENVSTEISGVEKVSLIIQLEGEFPNVLNFVDSIQKSTRLVLINKLGVASNISANDQPVTFTVDADVLYQK